MYENQQCLPLLEEIRVFQHLRKNEIRGRHIIVIVGANIELISESFKRIHIGSIQGRHL